MKYLKSFNEFLSEALDVVVPPHPGTKFAKPQTKEIVPDGGVVKNPEAEEKLVELFIKMRPGGELDGKKIDLCDFHLGNNLFCENTLSIPRMNMPQLSAGDLSLAMLFNEWTRVAKGEVIPDYSLLKGVKGVHVKDRIDMGKVKTRIVSIPAASLKATQNELNGGKISGMVQSIVSANFNKNAAKALYDPLVVSEDNYIVDGHHRWAALVVADVLNKEKDSPISIKVYQVGLPVTDIMALCYPNGPFDTWLQTEKKLKINAPQGFDVNLHK